VEAPLVALDAEGVPLLDGGGIALPERHHPADALAAARLHVRLAGAVAVLAGRLLELVAGMAEEQAAHPGLPELAECLLVAGLARLGAHVPVGPGGAGGRERARRRGLARLAGGQGEHRDQDQEHAAADRQRE
jgi:hypothetical protein